MIADYIYEVHGGAYLQWIPHSQNVSTSDIEGRDHGY